MSVVEKKLPISDECHDLIQPIHIYDSYQKIFSNVNIDFVAAFAVTNEILDLLIYAHTQGADIYFLFHITAKKGFLLGLKYLHEQGCRWTYRIIKIIAAFGYLDCLIYAVENGCTFHDDLISILAKFGHFDCLKYVMGKGFTYNPDKLLALVRNTEIEDWLCETYLKEYWKAQHIQYRKQLLPKDKMALNLYFGNYFFRAINATHQDLLQFSNLPTKWKNDAECYCYYNKYSFNPYKFSKIEFVMFVSYISCHINVLINSAPSVTETIVVYRGVKTPYFIDTYLGVEENDYFLHKGFISTSINRECAKIFSKDPETHEHQYMMIATISPGTKFLYNAREQEILLPMNMKIRVLEKMQSVDHKGEYKVEFFN